jgi:hypothetical protein
MAGPNTDPFSGIFFQDDPNINQQLRQRIALQMLANKRGAPKNLGEGINALGEAFGERMRMKRLGAQEAASEAARKAAIADVTGGSVAATPYAPPADVPDAVAAIDRAIVPAPAPVDLQPAPPLVTTPPGEQPASALLMPNQEQSVRGFALPTEQPASMLDPRPMARPPAAAPQQQAGVMDGGYNLLDAQSNFAPQRGNRVSMPGPGRVQNTVERIYPDNPDMQAYASRLAGQEQRGPGDTSETGARGPWQFVPGTARQYGLANPDDIDASGDALKAFTADNAATLERRLQRPPTMADLALAHQQGAGTAANMLAGAGNASGRNLALNNVPPGASPAAAAAQIKGYYGMPERPVNPRDALAATVMQQQATAGGPQANPTPPVDAPIMAFDGSPSPSAMPTGSPVRSAPPARPITAAPQADVADPGYVTPARAPTPRPVQVPMSDLERRIRQKIENTPPADRDAVAQGLAPYLQQEQERRAFQQTQINEEYKTKETQRFKIEEKREDMLKDKAERIQKYEKAKQDFIQGHGPSPSPQNLATLGTPESKQRSGIPVPDPAPPGVTPAKWAELQAPKLVKKLETVDKVEPQVADALATIRLAREHPGKEWGVGASSHVYKHTPQGAGFNAIVEQIKGKNFLTAYDQLRGAGAIGEKEGAAASAAQARINTAQTQKDFDSALLDLELALRRDMETAQRNVNRPVTAWRKPDDNATYAPDIGERRGNMEYVGGNPANRMSWRPVQ